MFIDGVWELLKQKSKILNEVVPIIIQLEL